MSSYEDILAKIIEELSKLTAGDMQLTADADLITDLGLDSFKVLDLLMDIEDEFDISMPMSLLVDVHTIADLAKKIHDTIHSR